MTNLPDDYVFQRQPLSPRSNFQEALECAAKDAEGDLLFYALFSEGGDRTTVYAQLATIATRRGSFASEMSSPLTSLPVP